MTILFDFDGVLMDTETLYTRFWDTAGRQFVDKENFGASIKGQTLKHILSTYFPDPELQRELVRRLDQYEHDMAYEYIPGAEGFLQTLRREGVKTAVVTSSDQKKMANVYRTHPEFQGYFDCILTSEDFRRSKPDPDCFLTAMQRLGARAEDTIVFEDSFFGLEAARASGAYVVALATTNPRASLAGKADRIIDNFLEIQGLDIKQ